MLVRSLCMVGLWKSLKRTNKQTNRRSSPQITADESTGEPTTQNRTDRTRTGDNGAASLLRLSEQSMAPLLTLVSAEGHRVMLCYAGVLGVNFAGEQNKCRDAVFMHTRLMIPQKQIKNANVTALNRRCCDSRRSKREIRVQLVPPDLWGRVDMRLFGAPQEPMQSMPPKRQPLRLLEEPIHISTGASASTHNISRTRKQKHFPRSACPQLPVDRFPELRRMSPHVEVRQHVPRRRVDVVAPGPHAEALEDFLAHEDPRHVRVKRHVGKEARVREEETGADERRGTVSLSMSMWLSMSMTHQASLRGVFVICSRIKPPWRAKPTYHGTGKMGSRRGPQGEKSQAWGRRKVARKWERVVRKIQHKTLDSPFDF